MRSCFAHFVTVCLLAGMGCAEAPAEHALSFDDLEDGADCSPDEAVVGELALAVRTIEAWLVFDESVWTDGPILGTKRLWFGPLEGGGLEIRSPQKVSVSGVLGDDALHHVAAVRSEDRDSLYVDGVEVALEPWEDLEPWSITDIRVGYDEEGTSGVPPDAFGGILDELRLSTSARYDGDFEPPHGPFSPDGDTALLVHFDEGEGSEAVAADGPDCRVFAEWVEHEL